MMTSLLLCLVAVVAGAAGGAVTGVKIGGQAMGNSTAALMGGFFGLSAVLPAAVLAVLMHERAIKEHAPEIVRVVQVHRPAATHPAHAPGDAVPMHFVSPFAKAGDRGFVDLCALAELPPGRLVLRRLEDQPILLHRDGDQVSCVDNACAHMGMPLDEGTVSAGGILECPHHGFRYLLATGECLDVPEVQLVVHAVRVRDGRVTVKRGG